MKLEQQVCSLELAKKLKELGVKQDSLFYWTQRAIEYNGHAPTEWKIQTYKGHDNDMYPFISAFTVAELGELMPYWLYIKGHPQICCYAQGKTIQAVDLEKHEICEYKGNLLEWKADTEADARAKILVYLLENKLITI